MPSASNLSLIDHLRILWPQRETLGPTQDQIRTTNALYDASWSFAKSRVFDLYVPNGNATQNYAFWNLTQLVRDQADSLKRGHPFVRNPETHPWGGIESNEPRFNISFYRAAYLRAKAMGNRCPKRLEVQTCNLHLPGAPTESPTAIGGFSFLIGKPKHKSQQSANPFIPILSLQLEWGILLPAHDRTRLAALSVLDDCAGFWSLSFSVKQEMGTQKRHYTETFAVSGTVQFHPEGEESGHPPIRRHDKLQMKRTFSPISIKLDDPAPPFLLDETHSESTDGSHLAGQADLTPLGSALYGLCAIQCALYPFFDKT